MSLTLRKVDPYSEADLRFLYDLLKLRMDEPELNISHRALPPYHNHVQFVRDNPYAAYYIVDVLGVPAGAAYLTRQNEIGVYLLPDRRGKKYGPAAVAQVMEENPREKYLANINPRNEISQLVFERLGFRLIQYTYEKVA
jgi:RimJ/RimL family protein N-acetyltransferase